MRLCWDSGYYPCEDGTLFSQDAVSSVQTVTVISEESQHCLTPQVTICFYNEVANRVPKDCQVCIFIIHIIYYIILYTLTIHIWPLCSVFLAVCQDQNPLWINLVMYTCISALIRSAQSAQKLAWLQSGSGFLDVIIFALKTSYRSQPIAGLALPHSCTPPPITWIPFHLSKDT